MGVWYLIGIVFYGLVLVSKMAAEQPLQIEGEIITINVPPQEMEINVSACGGRNVYHNVFVDDGVTWSRAMEACKVLGLKSLDYGLPNWSRRIDVRNYLESINYKNLNYTFWAGLFRPYCHVRKWYTDWGGCKEFNHDTPIGDPNTGQCAVFTRNEGDEFSESLYVENCDKLHPFLCVKVNGEVNLNAYEGFHLTATPKGASSIELVDVTFEYCLETCYYDSWCNAFTYSDCSGDCQLLNRIVGYNELHYTVQRTQVQTTHYTKTGCIVEFQEDGVDVTGLRDNGAFPECGVDEIPQRYCPCNSNSDETNADDIDEAVNEIIEELTVSRKSTSSYKRSLSSSTTDGRKVSKALGILGIAVVIGMLSALLAADICLKDVKRKKSENRRTDIK